MLNIGQWLKWIEKHGLELDTSREYNGCDVCRKDKRGNQWMSKDGLQANLLPVVCEKHGQEYDLIW